MRAWQQVTFVTVIAAFIIAAAHGLAQTQQSCPSKLIRIVVPASAGGTQDTHAIVNQINAEVARILVHPEVRERPHGADVNVVTDMPKVFQKTLRADIEVFSKVARIAGLVAK